MDINEFFGSLRQAPFGIEQEYTFYQDFQIADRVGGKKGVEETFGRCLTWASNPKAWGELTCALNWRLWDLHETNEEVARLYEQLWMKAQDIGWKNGNKDKEYASIYLSVTD